MNYKILFAGLVLFVIGYLYIYKQNIILWINLYLRTVVFSDIHVITSHKKIGVLFILIALIFIYAGIAYHH
jgi:hypothetical protein